MIKKTFSAVKDKNVILNEPFVHPYDEKQFLSKWYIEPVADIRRLSLHFPSQDYYLYYKTQVSIQIKYISYFLNFR